MEGDPGHCQPQLLSGQGVCLSAELDTWPQGRALQTRAGLDATHRKAPPDRAHPRPLTSFPRMWASDSAVPPPPTRPVARTSPMASCMSCTVPFSCSSNGPFLTPGGWGSGCPPGPRPLLSGVAKNCSRSPKELSLPGRSDEVSARGEGGPAGLPSAPLSGLPGWGGGMGALAEAPSVGLWAGLGSGGEGMQ